jgi:H+/Na+-translocating ferredoxin:NAD+ oxidoreductase subunit E
MTSTTSSLSEAIAPLWRDNMALAQLLGLCPLLAVTTTVVNGLALGLASAVVVVIASTTMAALRRALKPAARLPIALLILAALVTVIDLFTEALFFDLHGKLGIFIPLIVVNSGLLAHAENVASRRSVGFTFLSALATGLGFLLAFVALGAFREIVGHGTLLADIELLAGDGYRGMTLELGGGGMLVAILPPGAFFGMGLLLALRNRLTATKPRDDRSSSGTPR